MSILNLEIIFYRVDLIIQKKDVVKNKISSILDEVEKEDIKLEKLYKLNNDYLKIIKKMV